MATGIQTGIRTGSAPLPTGKGPAGGGGGLGKIMAQWTSMSVKAKIFCISIVVVLGGGLIIGLAITAANKPVSLYATNLSPADMAEIGQKLNGLNMPYTVEGSKILVPPSRRSAIIGLLLADGLPHRPLTTIKDDGGMSPKTDAEKRVQQNQLLENDLVDEIRQFDIVADAYVKIVPADEDSLEGKRDAKASVDLELKPGARPNPTQIQAILNLVAFSVPGLQPENVKVVDRSGYVWNNGDKIGAGPNPTAGAVADAAFGDQNLAIKSAYEKQYTDKIQSALNKILGSGNYTVSVNADLDFSQKKIVSNQVGAPGGDNSAVSQRETEKEIYNNGKGDKKTAQKAGASQVGVPLTGASNGTDTAYEKVKIIEKTQNGDQQSTVIVPPGMVRKLSASVSVNGKHDPAELAKLKNVVAGAIGMDETRGDSVTVDDMAFQAQAGVIGADGPPAGYWEGRNRDRGHSSSSTAIVAAMVVPTAILLMVLAIFLIKQRKVQADKTGLILSSSTGTTTSDISDLLSDKIGRSTAVSHTTKVNNTEQLEKLAKEKPTKVAELLKSTWLSDKER